MARFSLTVIRPGAHRRALTNTSARPRHVITIEAAFIDDGTWLIVACLRFRDRVPAKVARHVLADGRRALLAGIAREAVHGRSLGARKMRVRLDDGSLSADVDQADLDRVLEGPDIIH
jgi:hypothetical protein